MAVFRYPLALQTITPTEIDSLVEWLKEYPRLTKGALTIEFEALWAQYIGTKYSVFVNSGSSANLLMVYAALQAGKLKNKKVVVPAVGWVTTIAPVMQLGLIPIMIDADPTTFGIDLDALEKVCIEHNPAIVIFVQVLGIPHRLKIIELQEKYGFVLLEDACAALGAEYSGGRKVGTVGDMASFSFYMGHQLSTIEGGMINTNDEELYHLLLMLRSHGWGKDLSTSVYDNLMTSYNIDDFHQPFTFFVPGFNVRSTDLQAFLGTEQMKKAEWVAQRRYMNHIRYAKNLLGVNGLRFQTWGMGDKPASISFGVLASDIEHRKRIVKALDDNGVETRLFSAGNLGLHPFWKSQYGEFHGAVADCIHDCGLFLPNYPELTLEDVDSISNIVKSVR